MDTSPNNLMHRRVNTPADMARPEIQTGEDLRQRVEEYAHQNGLRMPRAYRELIESGLSEEGF